VDNILRLSGLKGGVAEPVIVWVGGGPSERQQRVDWSAAGIPLLEPSIKDVWSGIDKVYQLLKDGALLIHECCVNLLSEIGSYSRVVDAHGNVTDAISQKATFHCLDALRYVCVWLCDPEMGYNIVYNPVKIGPDY
jgi:hypothetical protein